jgi:Subtilase family
VQVAAPGVNVPAQGNDGQYWLVSGTSPACALTAGVAALIRSADPRLSPALVREAITTSTRNRPRGGYDEQVGFGTVDAAAALAAAARLSARADADCRLSGARARGGQGGLDAEHGAAAASYFGGGPQAVPPEPVGPRGLGQLVLFCALGLGCLAVIVLATSRLMLTRRHAAADATAAGGTWGHGVAAGYRLDPARFPGRQGFPRSARPAPPPGPPAPPPGPPAPPPGPPAPPDEPPGWSGYPE